MSDKAQPTPGPWKACGTIYEHMNAEVRSGAKGEGQAIAQVWDGPNAFADARLIAAAPDHALVARAFATAGARWEGWSAIKGEFCVDGMRYSTELDDFGVPVVTPAMRAAIAKATGA